MKYLVFSPQEHTHYEICFLVPELNSKDMRRIYVTPHLQGSEDSLLAYELYKRPKKTPVQEQKDFLQELLPVLKDLQTKYLVICDADYFKTIAKGASPEASLGYVMEGQDEFAGFKLVYCPNYRSMFFNPDKVKKDITQALYALKSDREGQYIPPGCDIINFEAYPSTVEDIADWLRKLLDMQCDLTADIEGFSLKRHEAGVGTISFAWNKHEGIAFAVDLNEEDGASGPIRQLLRDFFVAYHQQATRLGLRMRWHNASYDIGVLIYELFMKDLLDTEGLLHGLEIMMTNFDCTKLITYLATNSCAGNKLGLKDQSQEFAGKYAVDVTDIRAVPLDRLLRYNLIDALSTWFVYEKHWQRMIDDQQLPVYEELFRPSLIDITQMELTGLPVDMEEVIKLNHELEAYSKEAVDKMQSNSLIFSFISKQTDEAWERDYQERRAKAKRPEKIKRKDRKDFPIREFNPNSNPQLQRLLYSSDFFGLPVIDLTDTKAPATGGDTLENLRNHTTNQEVIEFLDALIEYKSVDKLLTSFMPNLLAARKGPDGWYYLFGNFNLGGTKSGRLSSSDPNMQNLPSKGQWAKKLKKCFKSPKGWLLVGLDFNSLEDMISALTTKDPNKIKVYTDGYDGHCLRAFGYFGDQMPDIDPQSVKSINSIKKIYPDLRDESKTPTFLLTYGGTWMGIIEQLGWDKQKAQTIEAKYHELYKVSDQWVADRIAEASQQGYVKIAFGLRLRTPILAQTVRGTSRTPYEAEAEARTAGNALGQSWCLLNNRASVEFMRKVRSSEYRASIRPCAHIHDAQYYLIPDDLEVLRYVNTHLVSAVRWQEDPLIQHDQVKLGGELSIFFPSWAEEMVVPNEASLDKIKELAVKHWNDYCG